MLDIESHLAVDADPLDTQERAGLLPRRLLVLGAHLGAVVVAEGACGAHAGSELVVVLELFHAAWMSDEVGHCGLLVELEHEPQARPLSTVCQGD